MCCYAARCANAHVLEWNGDLYACDHFVYRQWLIGNIHGDAAGGAGPLARGWRSSRASRRELPAACRDVRVPAPLQRRLPQAPRAHGRRSTGRA